MSELFDNPEDEKEEASEFEEEVSPTIEDDEPLFSDARRRLENLLEEKRLRAELEDFIDNDFLED